MEDEAVEEETKQNKLVHNTSVTWEDEIIVPRNFVSCSFLQLRRKMLIKHKEELVSLYKDPMKYVGYNYKTLLQTL